MDPEQPSGLTSRIHADARERTLQILSGLQISGGARVVSEMTCLFAPWRLCEVSSSSGEILHMQTSTLFSIISQARVARVNYYSLKE